MTTGRIIHSEACLREGADWLAAREPAFAMAFAQVGPLPLRRKAGGFGDLVSAIVSQQVSVASAEAIWQRLLDAGMTSPLTIEAASDEELRGLGLSKPKVRYLRALAMAKIDFEALARMPDPQVLDSLVKIPGIGLWTAEIYATFSLGRADVFAAGDLALQEAAKILFKLEARPSEKALRERALAWSPWRAVAARTLWAYYRISKQRDGIR